MKSFWKALRVKLKESKIYWVFLVLYFVSLVLVGWTVHSLPEFSKNIKTESNKKEKEIESLDVLTSFLTEIKQDYNKYLEIASIEQENEKEAEKNNEELKGNSDAIRDRFNNFDRKSLSEKEKEIFDLLEGLIEDSFVEITSITGERKELLKSIAKWKDDYHTRNKDCLEGRCCTGSACPKCPPGMTCQ